MGHPELPLEVSEIIGDNWIKELKLQKWLPQNASENREKAALFVRIRGLHAPDIFNSS